MALNIGSNLFGKADDEGKKKKEHYYSVHPSSFLSADPRDDDIIYGAGNLRVAGGIPAYLVAPLNLPHGAVITSAVVYGNVGLSTDGWIVTKQSVTASAGNTLAFANCNTWANANQAYSDVDNLNFHYCVLVTLPDATDELYGAVIIYTI